MTVVPKLTPAQRHALQQMDATGQARLFGAECLTILEPLRDLVIVGRSHETYTNYRQSGLGPADPAPRWWLALTAAGVAVVERLNSPPPPAPRAVRYAAKVRRR